MDYRLLHALFAVGLAVAVGVGAVLGNGHPERGHSHMLAFASNSTLCTAGDALCTGLYILNGDSVPQDVRGGGPLPAAAKLLVPGPDIVGLSWSPDATEIAYLVGRRAATGNNYFIQSIDLWRVRVHYGGSKLVSTDVASGEEEREYRLGDAIQWIGGRPILGSRAIWIRATAGPHKSLSPDEKFVAERQSGIDSNWICVRPPQSVQEPLGPGCFGDGRFTEPVWAPF